MTEKTARLILVKNHIGDIRNQIVLESAWAHTLAPSHFLLFLHGLCAWDVTSEPTGIHTAWKATSLSLQKAKACFGAIGHQK